MELIVRVAIIVHIIAGIGALISGAIAFGLRNNTPKHKPIGKIYFWCMTVIFVTGLFLSFARELLFFFYIAVFTYYSTIIAYRSLKLRNLHNGQKPFMIDWFIEIIAALTFIGLIAFSISLYFKNHNPGAIIPLVFGCIGLWGSYTNIKLFLKGPKETLYWYKKHIGNMMGSYIGGVTAFLVNQMEYIPFNPIILWLGPTVIIVPAIIIELKKVKSVPIEN